MSDDMTHEIEELNKQVEELIGLGKFQEAIPLAEKACELSREVHGEKHQDYANTLHNLGIIHYYLGNYSSAERLWLHTLEIRRETLGEEHLDCARSMNNLATVYLNTGNYSSAEQMLIRAKEIFRKTLGEEHPFYAATLDNLACVYWTIGDNSSAKSLHIQAKECRLKALGEEHPDYAMSLSNLANVYTCMGNYSDAESLLLETKKIFLKAFGKEHPEYANSIYNLANLYWEIGNYSSSESLHLEAREIRHKALGEENPDYANSLNSLAMLYKDLGDYSTAESLCLQAKEILRITLGDENPDYARNLNNLALLYIDMGDYSSAESLYLKAIESYRKAQFQEHPDYAMCLINLAELYRITGNYPACESYHLQVEAILFKALGEEHLYYAENQFNIGKLSAATGRENNALECLSKATKIHDRMIAHIFSFASDIQRMDYLKKIQPDFDVYISLVYQHFMDSPVIIQSTLDLILRRKAIAAEALAAQRDAIFGDKYPELREKLGELTSLRMQIALKTMKGPGPEGREYHDQLIKDWTGKKEKLETKLARRIPEMSLEERLRKADRKAVAKALPGDSVLVEFVKFNEYDFKAIPAKGEKEWKPARYLAFVLPSGKPDKVAMIDLGDAETIDRMISDFRNFIISGIDSSSRSGTTQIAPPQINRTENDGFTLRKAIFDKLAVATQGYRHILISPDGDLSRLPFEALPVENGKYLVDEYRISYLSVGRDVLRFAAKSSGVPSNPIVVADPDFDMGSLEKLPLKETDEDLSFVKALGKSRDFDRSTLKFERLPGTRPESERIASILKTKPWLEDQVLEGRLKSVHSPLIMHLATHGFFLEDRMINPEKESRSRYENPLLRSGLALAGANTFIKGGTLPDEAEDGLLTAEDVSGLDLLGTELVVLSACETGLGEIRTGEGVFGLRRAFMLAGTKTLVMSLWRVADLTTPIIMGRFYDNLLNRKLPRDASLREAQLYLRGLTIRETREKWLTKEMISALSSGNEKIKKELEDFLKLPDDTTPFTDPLYWGAFICQGDINPIKTRD